MSVVAAVLALSPGATARAISPLPPISIAAPVPTAPVPLRVLRDEITVTCVADERGLSCDVLGRYRYGNPGRDPVRAELSVESPSPAMVPLRVRVDGRLRRLEGTRITPFDVPPGGEVTVELMGRMRLPEDYASIFFLTPALMTRHTVLGEEPLPADASRLAYLPSDPERFTEGVSGPRVHVVAPSGWRVRSPESTSASRDTAGSEAPGSPWYVALQEQAKLLYHGGPFLAAGGTFGHGFLLRAGYEVGFHPLLLGSLAVESDLSDELAVTPLFEAALPTLVFIPSLGLGLGAPIRLLPETRAGLRVQLTASLLVSFVSSFDYFPADDEWRVSLLGQIGL